MKIIYDREVDALYIRFKETTVTTKPIRIETILKGRFNPLFKKP